MCVYKQSLSQYVHLTVHALLKQTNNKLKDLFTAALLKIDRLEISLSVC